MPRKVLIAVAIVVVCLFNVAHSIERPWKLAIWVDTSGSLNQACFGSALSELIRILPSLVREIRLSEIAIVPWASAADATAEYSTRVVMPKLREVAFRPPLIAGEMSIFKTVVEDELKRARNDFEREQQEAVSRYTKALEDSFKVVSSVLLRLRQGYSQCSAIGEALWRCGNQDSHNISIVITDGVQCCGPPLWRQRFEGKIAARVVVFLVPTTRDLKSGGFSRAFQARKQAIEKLVPGAIVLPSFDIMGDWPELLFK